MFQKNLKGFRPIQNLRAVRDPYQDLGFSDLKVFLLDYPNLRAGSGSGADRLPRITFEGSENPSRYRLYERTPKRAASSAKQGRLASVLDGK